MAKEGISGAVSADVRQLLEAHASDCGRSRSAEVNLWLTVGAALIEWTATLAPGAEARLLESGLGVEEVEATRQGLLERLQRDLSRALPHGIDPEVVISAAMPSMSMN